MDTLSNSINSLTLMLQTTVVDFDKMQSEMSEVEHKKELANSALTLES